MSDRGKSQGWLATCRRDARSGATPASSAISRTTHSSSDSPNSTKPASVDHRPGAQPFARPSKHRSRRSFVTSTMTDGSRRGRTRVSQSTHWRFRPWRTGFVRPPHDAQ